MEPDSIQIGLRAIWPTRLEAITTCPCRLLEGLHPDLAFADPRRPVQL